MPIFDFLNPLFKKITMVQFQNVMAALRGPDYGPPWIKEEVTAPIRLWVYGEGYSDMAFVPFSPSKVDPLTKERVVELLERLKEEARLSEMDPHQWSKPNAHCIRHLALALRVIANLEGWGDF